MTPVRRLSSLNWEKLQTSKTHKAECTGVKRDNKVQTSCSARPAAYRHRTRRATHKAKLQAEPTDQYSAKLLH